MVEYLLGLYIKEYDLPRSVAFKGSLDVGDQTKHDHHLLNSRENLLFYLNLAHPMVRRSSALVVAEWR